MDYGRLIEEAWRITRRHRFLWLYGLFAGAGGGSCGLNSGSGFRAPGGDGEIPDGALSSAANAVGRWVTDNIALVLAAFAVVFLLGLVLIVLHFVAKGALIASSARLARGEPTTRGEGWALGRRYAWTYARLTVLLLAVGLLVLVVVGILVAVVAVVAGASTGLAVVVGILLGLGGVLFLIAGGVVLSIVVAYAERAIAVDAMGARAAFRRGIALFRLRLGSSLLLWLVSLALGIGVGIAFVVLALLLLVPVGGAVLAAYLSAGLTGATVAVGTLAGLLFVAVLWGLGGVASAFLSTFWTLAYLSATERLSPVVAPE